MELYYMLAVMDRSREHELLDICEELNISLTLTKRGWGTATQSHLQLHDLQPTEKAVFSALVTAPSMKQLIRVAQRKMYIDIPGNGIMMYVPIKSIIGKNALAYFTDGQNTEGTVPSMEFKNELIVVILNEGHADSVMDAAREAGATGGTILHAKGTAGKGTEKFYRVSVAEEKDLIYILAAADKKAQIMKAINRTCGVGTDAGAISFSLPVSKVVGIRRLEDDAEQEA